jgi:hypothetical protein
MLETMSTITFCQAQNERRTGAWIAGLGSSREIGGGGVKKFVDFETRMKMHMRIYEQSCRR